MAKQSISSGLQQMKFMQRAQMRSEAAKQSEENELDGDDTHWVMPSKSKTGSRKNCAVIMEGDPKPGALFGRMSFQNFNPSVDKLVEEAEGFHKRRLGVISEVAGKSTGDSEAAEPPDRQKNGSGPDKEPSQTARSNDTFWDQSTKKAKMGTNSTNSFGLFQANYKQQETPAIDARFKKPSAKQLGQGRANWKHASHSTHTH